MDQEQQRDHAEEAENARILATGDGEAADMLIECREWNGQVFVPHALWRILEPFACREPAEWFEIVTRHIPLDTPAGTYAFTLWRDGGLFVAKGEFGWDGSVATRREGATAP